MLEESKVQSQDQTADQGHLFECKFFREFPPPKKLVIKINNISVQCFKNQYQKSKSLMDETSKFEKKKKAGSNRAVGQAIAEMHAPCMHIFIH